LAGTFTGTLRKGRPWPARQRPGALQPANSVEAGDQLAHRVGSAIALERRPRLPSVAANARLL